MEQFWPNFEPGTSTQAVDGFEEARGKEVVPVVDMDRTRGYLKTRSDQQRVGGGGHRQQTFTKKRPLSAQQNSMLDFAVSLFGTPATNDTSAVEPPAPPAAMGDVRAIAVAAASAPASAAERMHDDAGEEEAVGSNPMSGFDAVFDSLASTGGRGGMRGAMVSAGMMKRRRTGEDETGAGAGAGAGVRAGVEAEASDVVTLPPGLSPFGGFGGKMVAASSLPIVPRWPPRMGLDPLATESPPSDRALITPLSAMHTRGMRASSGPGGPYDAAFGQVTLPKGSKTMTNDVHVHHAGHFSLFFWRTRNETTVATRGFPQGSILFVATSGVQKPISLARGSGATHQPALVLQDLNSLLLEDAQRGSHRQYNSVHDIQKDFQMLGIIEAAMTTGEDTTLGIDFGRPANGAQMPGKRNMYTFARRGMVSASDLWDNTLPAGTEIGLAVVQCNVSKSHAHRSDQPSLREVNDPILNAFQIMPLRTSVSKYDVSELSFISSDGRVPRQVGWIHMGQRFSARKTGRSDKASKATEAGFRAISYTKGTTCPMRDIWFLPDGKKWGF